MSRLIFKFSLIAAAIFFGRTATASEPTLLPGDTASPVVEMWYLNGQTPSHAEVIVLADGRMQIMSPEGPQRSELSIAEVEELLQNLWNVDGLSTVHTNRIQHEIHQASTKTGLSSHIKDAGETVLRIRTAKGVRELRCPAVGVLAVRYPEVQCVQAMAAAQRRLENIRAVASVGGSDEADDIANLAARAVQNKYGVDVPVSSADLSMVRALPDGSRFCQFVVAMEGQDSNSLQMISLVEMSGHHPRVSMIGGATVR